MYPSVLYAQVAIEDSRIFDEPVRRERFYELLTLRLPVKSEIRFLRTKWFAFLPWIIRSQFFGRFGDLERVEPMQLYYI